MKQLKDTILESFDDGIGRRIMSLEESYCTEMGFDCDFADYHEAKLFLSSSLDKVFQAVEGIVGEAEPYDDITGEQSISELKGMNLERNRIRQEINKLK